jgi:hypothetical protein
MIHYNQTMKLTTWFLIFNGIQEDKELNAPVEDWRMIFLIGHPCDAMVER